jgi:hypothetical protein
MELLERVAASERRHRTGDGADRPDQQAQQRPEMDFEADGGQIEACAQLLEERP